VFADHNVIGTIGADRMGGKHVLRVMEGAPPRTEDPPHRGRGDAAYAARRFPAPGDTATRTDAKSSANNGESYGTRVK